MLPENLPVLPQLRIAARYDPGVDGNAAGGDFYDAFVLPTGDLGVVLGDVAGHDVQAAARMGQVRAALRRWRSTIRARTRCSPDSIGWWAAWVPRPARTSSSSP